MHTIKSVIVIYCGVLIKGLVSAPHLSQGALNTGMGNGYSEVLALVTSVAMPMV